MAQFVNLTIGLISVAGFSMDYADLLSSLTALLKYIWNIFILGNNATGVIGMEIIQDRERFKSSNK